MSANDIVYSYLCKAGLKKTAKALKKETTVNVNDQTIDLDELIMEELQRKRTSHADEPKAKKSITDTTNTEENSKTTTKKEKHHHKSSKVEMSKDIQNDGNAEESSHKKHRKSDKLDEKLSKKERRELRKSLKAQKELESKQKEDDNVKEDSNTKDDDNTTGDNIKQDVVKETKSSKKDKKDKKEHRKSSKTSSSKAIQTESEKPSQTEKDDIQKEEQKEEEEEQLTHQKNHHEKKPKKPVKDNGWKGGKFGDWSGDGEYIDRRNSERNAKHHYEGAQKIPNAARTLHQTKGSGFQKAKTKLKRTDFRGKIDTNAVTSFKFED